jgi:peptidoglycan-associated lipoprotein
MDRKWIVLATLLSVLLITTGCSKDKPDVTPPPAEVEVEPPPTDVRETPKPAPVADQTEKKPPESITQLQDRLESQGLLGDVFYDFDKYDLRPEARERLAKNAEFLNSTEGRDLQLTIEGHCDERGTNEYNIALGQNRSDSALDYIISLGVDRSRFRTISYGEERPFCTESTDACWQKNRRARFVITGR